MEPFEAFEQNMREMLNHLYDPAYRPPESLWKDLRLNREQGLEPLRSALLTGIEDLKPSDQVPLTALSWRMYGMLRYRYVENLPQEVTAEKLGITSRHLRRRFLEAVHALALTLWEKYGGEMPDRLVSEFLAAEAPMAPEEDRDNQVGWHAQLARELESLEETAAGVVSNMDEISASVLRLAGHLTSQRGVIIQAGPHTPQLIAAIHPSALRQILIAVVDQLSQQMEGGEISLGAEQANGRVRINISADPVDTTDLSEFDSINELLSSFNLMVDMARTENTVRITLELLQVDRRVLVVDDNAEIVHVYRRYLAGTRYYLVHISRGEQVFEAVKIERPHLVVLDVMLPDVDGWDLLTHLHENPATRALPVIICSVMREKKLALALGARYFLSKPVQRHDFISALDTVLKQA